MSENVEKKEGEGEEAPKKSSLVTNIAVGTVALGFGLGTGAAVPMMMSSDDTKEEQIDEQPGEIDASHLVAMEFPEEDGELGFVEFDEIIVNLQDERYSRFLNCKFSLQVDAAQLSAIEELVAKKNVMLKNWIIAHLRDKQLDAIKGMVGQNALRREIHAKFNEILFTDGIERVQDVLFQDLKVQ
ncbi:MAG: flagellar basal body-associated FliL family protein [Planctomycetota bacterium]|nr:flagellar basal body-associated FliL family protein [Planctomycetota bacterium]